MKCTLDNCRELRQYITYFVAPRGPLLSLRKMVLLSNQPTGNVSLKQSPKFRSSKNGLNSNTDLKLSHRFETSLKLAHSLRLKLRPKFRSQKFSVEFLFDVKLPVFLYFQVDRELVN